MPLFFTACLAAAAIFLWQSPPCPPCAQQAPPPARQATGGPPVNLGVTSGAIAGGAVYRQAAAAPAPSLAPKPKPAVLCHTCMGLYGTYVDSTCPCNDPNCLKYGDCGPCSPTSPNAYGSFTCQA